jgi:hypothetical protein
MYNEAILQNLHKDNAKFCYLERITNPRPHTKAEMDSHWFQAEDVVRDLKKFKTSAGMKMTPKQELELVKRFAYQYSLSDREIPRETSTPQQMLDDWHNGGRLVSYSLTDQYLSSMLTENYNSHVQHFHFHYLNDISIECYKITKAYLNYLNLLEQGKQNSVLDDYYQVCNLLSKADNIICPKNHDWCENNFYSFINSLNTQIKQFDNDKDMLFEKIINRKFFWASLGNTKVGDLHSKDDISEYVFEIYEYILDSKVRSTKKRDTILNLLANNPHITNISELVLKHHITCNTIN